MNKSKKVGAHFKSNHQFKQLHAISSSRRNENTPMKIHNGRDERSKKGTKQQQQ